MDTLGVLVTAYEPQFSILPECIDSCRKIGDVIIALSNDYSLEVEVPENISNTVDKVLYQPFGGRSRHWIYHQLKGFSFLSKLGVKCVLSINGDCVMNLPENFREFYYEFIRSGKDIVCATKEHLPLELGTLWVLYKIEAMEIIVNSLISDFNNWPKLSCEKRLFDAVNKNNLSVMDVENPEHYTFKPELNLGKKGTLIKKLGLVHKHVDSSLFKMKNVERENKRNLENSKVKERKAYKYSKIKKKIDYDKFVLVIGHGRSGTSLCVGLINSSPHMNLGYEVNNPRIHLLNCAKGKVAFKSMSKRKISESRLPYKYNGNKIVLETLSSILLIKYFHKFRTEIIHDRFRDLKVVFTKRDPISIVVSEKKRKIHKGIEVQIPDAVENYFIIEEKIKELKEYFKNYYVFDFDEAIKDPYSIKGLFDFIGEKFFYSYVLYYQGINNYSHAKGVGPKNVLYGIEDKFADLRKEVELEFNKRRILNEEKENSR